MKKGQAIALIDPTQLQIKKNQIVGNIQQAKQQLGQLDAQIKALKGQIAAEAELTQKQRDCRERKLTSTNDVEEAEASVRLALIEVVQKTHADLKSAEAIKRSRMRKLCIKLPKP